MKGLIMRQIENRKFYTYKQAAKRVGRNPQTIRRWRAAGMPMTWNTNGERIVAHGILLAELRRRREDDLSNRTPEKLAARAAAEADMIAWLTGDEDPDHAVILHAVGAPQEGSPAPATQAPKRAGLTAAASAPRPEQGPAPMRPGPAAAWARLRAALATTTPDCAEDGRYTLDALAPGEAEYLARVCADCPLLAACAGYAAEAKPTGGFWPTPENMAALAADRQRSA